MREYGSAAAKLSSPSQAPSNLAVANYFAVPICGIENVNIDSSKGSDSGQGTRSFERSEQNAIIGKTFVYLFAFCLSISMK